MFVVVPAQVNVISTSVPEDDFPEWSNSANYVAGDKRIVLATHKIYEATGPSGPSTTVKYPPDDVTAVSPVWQEYGYTNAYRMFDEYVNTQTSKLESFAVRIAYYETIDTLVLMATECERIHVTQYDANGAILQDVDISMDLGQYEDEYDWCFGPDRYVEEVLINMYMDFGYADITFFSGSAATNATCGKILIGTRRSLGSSQFGAKGGILDYSKASTTVFGATFLKPGKYAKRADLDVEVPLGYSPVTKSLLTSLRGTAAYFVGDNYNDAYGILSVYGFLADWSFQCNEPEMVAFSIQLTGLI